MRKFARNIISIAKAGISPAEQKNVDLALEAQKQAPVLDAMENFAKMLEKDGYVNLFSMGHVSSKEIDPQLIRIWGSQAIDRDYYPRNFLDSLENPVGEIKKALELAKKLYKTKETFFSSSGTSPMVTAMIASAVSEGEKILLPRHAHKSVLSGLLLSGAIPVYMQPPQFEERRILLNNTAEQVEEALEKHPDIKTVMIMSPTAYGIHADIERIAKLVHSKGKIFIVDEAWGSLMPFCNKYPKSAIYAGADMCTHSNHKDAHAFVSSGLLHVCTDRINPVIVRRILTRLLTTSPSFWQVSSQDACRRFLALKGEEIALRVADNATKIRAMINKIPGFYCPSDDLTKRYGCHAYSPNKIVVCIDHLGLTGWEIHEMLLKRFKIGVGYPSLAYFVPFNTYTIPMKSWEALAAALTQISKEFYDPNRKDKFGIVRYPPLPPMAMTQRQVQAAKNLRMIPLNESLGKIIGQAVYAYPPGMPIIADGEIMTPEVLKFINEYLDAEKKGLMKSSNTLLGLEDGNTKVYVID